MSLTPSPAPARALAAAALALAVAAAPAGPARAHEVLHDVKRGRAVALHAWFPDGESLAYVQAEVYSPADAAVPHWKGRTDRNGWVAFVPDVAGKWRVRIVDTTGHGLDTTVEVTPADLAGSGVPGGGATGGGSGDGGSGAPATMAFLLRPVVGVLLIVAIFGALHLFRRRRRSP